MKVEGPVEIVLGVSMTSTAVRMVLVEGAHADGVTVDHDTFAVGAGSGTAASQAADQVIAAILGTRESALEGGHRLVSTGVAWTDHAAAAYLRDALRAHGLDDVVLVSELHAASALAQAIGQTMDCDRTALVFLEGDTATLAVVQTADGAVVKVQSRDSAAVPEMIAGLEALDAPPAAVFVMGSGLGDADTEAIRSQIAGRTILPVHAPQDADLALARGAALAGAHTPRFEAETVGLAPPEITAAGPTQMAPAGYMAPLGYSAVPDEDDDVAGLFGYDGEPDAAEPDSDPARKHFLLVGSALSAVFVVGVAALVISLAVSIRPAVDQRPDPGPTAGQTSVAPAPAPDAVANPAPAPAPPPQTIQAPVPVVQVAPRTVYVAPAPQAPVVAPAAPVVDPVPAAPVPEPVAVAPAPAPAPAAPPIVAPIIPPWLRGPQLPSIFLPPGTNAVPAQSVPAQTYPTQAVPAQTPAQAPAQANPTQPYPSSPSTGSESGGGPARGDHRNPLWPIWPPFG